jgi:UDP-glucose 4-epimerase
MRRVLVTGASMPLGRRIVARLQRRVDVETVVGVDVHDGAHPSLTELIDGAAVDTIIHAGMCPSRSGAPSRREVDVVSTQQLTAAVSARDRPARVVAAVSSTEVYDAASFSPLWRREDELLEAGPGSDASLILEAERYLRDLAERQPHISVAILRCADLVGPGISSPLPTLLQGWSVPFVAGYDPPIQLLHVDDAVAAVEHAASHELAGTINVAGGGFVRWRQAARLIGRPAVPAAVVPAGVAALMAPLGLPHVPSSLADVLRFGRCVDTTALTTSGFVPEHATEACVRSIRHATTPVR